MNRWNYWADEELTYSSFTNVRFQGRSETIGICPKVSVKNVGSLKSFLAFKRYNYTDNTDNNIWHHWYPWWSSHMKTNFDHRFLSFQNEMQRSEATSSRSHSKKGWSYVFLSTATYFFYTRHNPKIQWFRNLGKHLRKIFLGNLLSEVEIFL